MKCSGRCLAHSRCLILMSGLQLCVFFLVLSDESLSRNGVIYNSWIWTLGWGAPPDHLPRTGPRDAPFRFRGGGCSARGGSGGLAGTEHGECSQASPDPYRPGMFPVPAEAWELSNLKPRDGPSGLEMARVRRASSSPGYSSGFRRTGSATPGKRDGVSRPPLRSSVN